MTENSQQQKRADCSQKLCSPPIGVDDVISQIWWSQSPTSTTDAILDRFPQTTARWKALVKLEPIRPITGSVAVVAASASEWSVDSAPTIRALVSGSFFVANQVAWP